MLTLGGIDENLRFLVLEVSRQVDRTQAYLRHPSDRGRTAILSRDDYVDRLRTIIQRKCFNLARELDRDARMDMQLLRALDGISSNLERIADFCESVVQQFEHLEHRDLIVEAHPDESLEAIGSGVDQVEDALFGRDIQKALEICRIEVQLDALYEDTFRKVLAGLEAGGHSQSLVTVLFISHYFERMGDAMLNIGEGILSASLGEKIKIDEFHALQDTMEQTGALKGGRSAELSLRAMGETRSGCRIDRLTTATGEGDDTEQMIVLKEGRVGKIREEKEAVDEWNRRLPGLAPKIYSFTVRDGVGAILYEYLAGRTFEELLLRSDHEELVAAIAALQRTLARVWDETRSPEPAAAGFVAQIEKRMPDVYALHPEMRSRSRRLVGGLELESFDELVDRARSLDGWLTAPFSVQIHGDMNVDNVIFDPIGRQVRFVDLRRSTASDYVQDISVFLVSHFRLQVFEAPIRRRIRDIVSRVHAFASDYAARNGDPGFDARLALGLARSFATSARFVVDEEFAKSLFFRGRYLLERLCRLTPEEAADYRLPEDIFVD
jgi:phosphate uptake regulator/aminoglycoside phosphotransferase (APT) family kinase protein